MTTLAGWENFYVIVGSSAGALIGLQFVVMALVADMPRSPMDFSRSTAGLAIRIILYVHDSTQELFPSATLRKTP
jgi:hypothetical protein